MHIITVTIDSGERLFPVSRQQGKILTGGQVGRQLRQAFDAVDNGVQHRIVAALARTVVIVSVDGLHQRAVHVVIFDDLPLETDGIGPFEMASGWY